MTDTEPYKIYLGNERSEQSDGDFRRGDARGRGRDGDGLPPGNSFANPMIMTVLESMIPP